MKLSFSPLDKEDASEIIGWRYDPPYDVYDLVNTDTIQYLINPENQFYAFMDEHGNLHGYCSFGNDGQVPGGDYDADALDIGMGIHPDCVGKGLGDEYVSAVLKFAEVKFSPPQFRVTIAKFNKRAQKVWEKVGFHPVQHFTFTASGKEFLVNISQNKE